MNKYTVNWAYFGSMANDDGYGMKDVQEKLQELIEHSPTGEILIDVQTLKVDPIPNKLKGFCASVTTMPGDITTIYICHDGETVDFFKQ